MALTALAQDSNRDFVLVNGIIQTVTDVNAALVIIDNVIRGQKGEYRYDQTTGVDYDGNVFGATPNYQLFEAQVRTNVMSLSFVESIDSFEYDIDTTTGTLSYDMTVTTTYGSTVDIDSDTVNQFAYINNALFATQNYVAAGANYATTFQI